MSFSARQQYCLEAMGIVPWVSKNQSLVAKVDLSLTRSDPAIVPIRQVIAATGSMPQDIDELRAWLPVQPLGVLSVRSEPRSFIGLAEAPLLIVVDQGESATAAQSAATTALSLEASQLFDLMMRAINITLKQRKVCRLSFDAGTAASKDAAHVLDLCVPQTKAILLLVQDWHSLSSPGTDHFRLEHPSLPVWRIPHPDLLLEFNQLKRQAWISLQALQSAVA